MRGYYILFSPWSGANTGVSKKIASQIKALNNSGIDTQLVSLFEKLDKFGKIKKKFNMNYYIKLLPDDFFNVDFYYIRHISFSISVVGLLKSIAKKGKGKVIVELPTYPYDKEYLDTLSNKITLAIDRILRKRLSKYIQRIATFSTDDSIYGIKTLKIMNGIDCDDIPVRTVRKISNDINLIAVALFSRWHGYDRLIAGLKKYYADKPEEIVNVYFVGNGDEMPAYKKMAEECRLSEYITFTGFLTGDSLTAIYNNADMAVCPLGCHRIGIYLGSFLKSREYLARGFPMVSSTKIDVLPDDFKYCLYVPEDETPVDIRSIIEFYNKLPERDAMIHDIRTFAENYCDMSKTMLPVIEYLKK